MRLRPSCFKPADRPRTATTKPSTHPAIASTQGVIPGPDWIWTFATGGAAEIGQVNELLGTFKALKVQEYIEPGAFKGNTYTLTLHGKPSKTAAGKKALDPPGGLRGVAAA